MDPEFEYLATRNRLAVAKVAETQAVQARQDNTLNSPVQVPKPFLKWSASFRGFVVDYLDHIPHIIVAFRLHSRQ